MKEIANPIKDHLEYLDGYINSGNEISEEQKAIFNSLSNDSGKYKSIGYNSDRFRRELAHLFITRIGERTANIMLSEEFEKALKKDSRLIEKLNQIDIKSVVHLGDKINKISENDWINGEREDLLKTYNDLISLYSQFKKDLNVALGIN